MDSNYMKNGTVEGTGAAINISVGFIPRRVVLENIDGDAILTWTPDMGDDGGYKTVAAGTNAHIASGGITGYSGSASAAEGFTIGTDTDVNVSDETIIWTAFR